MNLSKMPLSDLIHLEWSVQLEIASRLMFLFIIALAIFCLYSYYKMKIK